MMAKEICKFCVLIAFLGVSLNVNSQVIDYVEHKHQADVNVYFVKWRYEADAVVYKSIYKSYSKKEGFWYIAHGSLHNHHVGAVKVRVVKYKHEADVLIYFTEWKSSVRVNECYKSYFK